MNKINLQGDLGFLIADDADVAQSIVEKANALRRAGRPAEPLTSATSHAVAKVKAAASASAAEAEAGVGWGAGAGAETKAGVAAEMKEAGWVGAGPGRFPNGGRVVIHPQPNFPSRRGGGEGSGGIGSGSGSLHRNVHHFPPDPPEGSGSAAVGLDEGCISGAKLTADGVNAAVVDRSPCLPPLASHQQRPPISSFARGDSVVALAARIDEHIDDGGSDDTVAASRGGTTGSGGITESDGGGKMIGSGGITGGGGIPRGSGTNGARGAGAGAAISVSSEESAEVAISGNRGGNSEGGGGEAGYVVLVTPTLSQVSALVEALQAPQVRRTGIVVVCPLYDWNQEQDVNEMRRLRRFPQVGKHFCAFARS